MLAPASKLSASASVQPGYRQLPSSRLAPHRSWTPPHRYNPGTGTFRRGWRPRRSWTRPRPYNRGTGSFHRRCWHRRRDCRPPRPCSPGTGGRRRCWPWRRSWRLLRRAAGQDATSVVIRGRSVVVVGGRVGTTRHFDFVAHAVAVGVVQAFALTVHVAHPYRSIGYSQDPSSWWPPHRSCTQLPPCSRGRRRSHSCRHPRWRPHRSCRPLVHAAGELTGSIVHVGTGIVIGRARIVQPENRQEPWSRWPWPRSCRPSHPYSPRSDRNRPRRWHRHCNRATGCATGHLLLVTHAVAVDIVQAGAFWST